jgi:hypothetical protein
MGVFVIPLQKPLSRKSINDINTLSSNTYILITKKGSAPCNAHIGKISSVARGSELLLVRRGKSLYI